MRGLPNNSLVFFSTVIRYFQSVMLLGHLIKVFECIPKTASKTKIIFECSEGKKIRSVNRENFCMNRLSNEFMQKKHTNFLGKTGNFYF